MKYLKNIHCPADLKKIPVDKLDILASEVRQHIINVLSVTGGHLASNLGSVELSIAMHYVFSSPEDKFIFDVSHQCYTHKLLTGRHDEKFSSIRKSGGYSGFCHPEESPHDHYYAGHAATALSLGLGEAEKRDLLQENAHIIPVIGDATLTCGLALEALNNISRKMNRFVVLLNDNAMSISRNVGHITHILSRLISNPTTNKLVMELERLIAKIPKCGTLLAEKSHKLAGSVKNLVSPAPFFEQFGLSYIGPIDGHDIKKMVAVFQEIKDSDGPVLVHLFTKKGAGVEKAEKDPITFHGVKPFDPKTCEFLPAKKNAPPSFPKLFGKYILELGEQDKRIATITPATSRGSQLDPFMDRFPERSFDVGIAEGHAVTFAGGLAKGGKLKVFCAVYATFLQRAFDNLFHDVCLQKSPVIFAVDRAGLAMADGATHHGIFDISFLRTMPNMIICQPRNGQLLKDLMYSALDWNQPTAIRYPNIATEAATEPPSVRRVGKADVLHKGSELLIVTLGHMYQKAFELKERLQEYGVEPTIVDAVFVKPLDTELLSELMLTHQKVVTIEEHSLKGGLGDEVNQFLLGHSYEQTQVINFGILQNFFHHATYDELLEKNQMSTEQMTKRIASQFSLKSGRVVEQV